MISDWEMGKGVHQWYAIKDDHVITADSLGNLYLYVIDFENQERDDE